MTARCGVSCMGALRDALRYVVGAWPPWSLNPAVWETTAATGWRFAAAAGGLVWVFGGGGDLG